MVHVDLTRRQGCVPLGSKFFHFHEVFAKNLQKNTLAHPVFEMTPPQKNPGFATVYYFFLETYSDTVAFGVTGSLLGLMIITGIIILIIFRRKR